MAIYKLGDIFNIHSGKKTECSEGSFKVIGSGGFFGLTNSYLHEGEMIILPRKGTMKISFIKDRIWNVDTAFVMNNPSKDIALTKFVYLLLNSNKGLWSGIIHGTTRPATRISDWRELRLGLPPLIDQQKIIDIIEPIEEIINTLNSLNNKIKELERKLIIFSERTNNEFNYNKGGQPNKETEGAKTIFLNVSAANGKPNRLVTNEPNIFIGDVTLSLDGNCGLVNNALEGFNGYLYKVFSDKFDSWQVYYSLLTRESQEIIKMNETGTTIMHAPGAKKDLRLFEFKYSELLENFFKLRTIHKLCFDKLNEQRDKLIELLVK